MLFVVLTSLCAWKGRYMFSALSSGYQLPSFGFEENGTFKFTVRTSKGARLSLFLATSAEIRSKTYRGVKFVSSCKDPTEHISLLNRTFREQAKTFEWTGKIATRNVYWPYFVSCEENVSNFDVYLEFGNPTSLIDYRDEHYSLLDLILCFVYAALATIWLVNGLAFSHFFIASHCLLGLVAATKALSMAISSRRWEDARIGNEVSLTTKLFGDSIIALHYTLLLSVPLLILSGWCTFIESYDPGQMGSIVGSAFVLVFGVMTVMEVTSVAEALVSMALIVFGFLWYLKNCTEVGILVGRLRSLEIAPGTAHKKVKIVASFGYTLAILIVCVLSACLGTMTFDMWPIVSSVMIEAGFVCLQIIEMKFFLLRDSYGGDALDGEDEDASVLLRVIDDPNGKGYAVISHE